MTEGCETGDNDDDGNDSNGPDDVSTLQTIFQNVYWVSQAPHIL